jgi:hypothetical protein
MRDKERIIFELGRVEKMLLQDYCKRNNLTVAEVLRNLIAVLLSKKGNYGKR